MNKKSVELDWRCHNCGAKVVMGWYASVELARQLRRQGLLVKEIADQLHRAETTISRWTRDISPKKRRCDAGARG